MAAAAIVLVRMAPAQQADSAPNPHDVQPERPTVATHAGTVAPGWVEIETGLQADYLTDTRVITTPTNLKFGVVPRVQAAVLSAWVQKRGSGFGSSGIGDMSLAVKWRMFENLKVLGDFAVLPALKLPTGSPSAGTGTGTTDVSLLLISSKQVGRIALDVNLGMTWRSGSGETAPRQASLWTVSAGVPLGGPILMALEVFGYPGTSGPVGTKPVGAVLAGPTFLVRRWLELDVGAILPIFGPYPHSVYAGLVWNIGRL